MDTYTEAYYLDLQAGSLRSARVIVPLVMELVHPRCVVDVGCGTGAWLQAFRENGIMDGFGVDRAWVEDLLLFPREQFVAADLREPFEIERRFDLVLSLEVAEHLPGDRADAFVETLTRLGPVVLFSAAVPLQEGTEHVNEQWPDYWTDRFRRRGYVPVDCLRARVWHREEVEAWYLQNMMFFVAEDRLDDYPALKKHYEGSALLPLAVVHPKLYEAKVAWLKEQNAKLASWGMTLEQEKAASAQEKAALEQEKALLEEVNGGLQERLLACQALQPGTVSLRQVIRAIPALTRHAISRRISRLSKRKP